MKANKIRITKEFGFEMAHALKDYDGPCRNVHGHSYELKVTVIGTPLIEKGNPKSGMVIDFGDLKRIVTQQIIDVFDHSLVLNKEMDSLLVDKLQTAFEKIILLDYQPTSELMVQDFAQRIQDHLPKNVQLVCVLLRETKSSYAEWFAADQK